MGNGAMKKLAIRVAAPLLLLAGIGIVSFQAMGEPEVFEIKTCKDLENISNDLTAHYELAQDIDCTETPSWDGGKGFMPIGMSSSQPFVGILDGKNFTVTGLTINGGDYAGLFMKTAGAHIVNTTFEALNVAGNLPVGGIAAEFGSGSVIDNIHVTGRVYERSTFGFHGIGGLVGHVNFSGGTIEASIKNSSYEGSVDGQYSPGAHVSGGGLVGWVSDENSTFSIENSYFKGAVFIQGTAMSAGGLIGSALGNIEIKNCYADVVVRAERDAAGLLYGSAVIVNSYATGTVMASGWSGGPSGAAGLLRNPVSGSSIKNSYATTVLYGEGLMGLVGATGAASVENSYWAYDIAGTKNSKGGEGKSAADMKKQSTFAGWDFTHVWTIDEGKSYPTLKTTPASRAAPAKHAPAK